MILSNDQESDCALFALDAATGQVRWKLPRTENHSNFATPCIYRRAGGPAQVIVSSWRLGITGVELATGRQLWQKAVSGQKQERAIASPFVAGDMMIANCGFAGRDKHVVVPRPGATAGTMDEAWRVEKGAPHIPSPIAVGDRAFPLERSGCHHLREAGHRRDRVDRARARRVLRLACGRGRANLRRG